LVWLLATFGAAAAVRSTIVLVLQVCRTGRAIRRWIPEDARLLLPPALATQAEALGLAGRIDLVDSPSLYAFCYGFLKPRVCVTTGLVSALTPAELEAILLHERYHLVNHDPLKGLIARALSAGLFFVPILDELAERYCQGRELAADDAALAQAGRKALASALYKTLTSPQAVALSPGPALGGAITAERVDRLLMPGAASHRPLPRARLAVSLLTAALLLASVAQGLAGPELASTSRLPAGTPLLSSSQPLPVQFGPFHGPFITCCLQERWDRLIQGLLAGSPN